MQYYEPRSSAPGEVKTQCKNVYWEVSLCYAIYTARVACTCVGSRVGFRLGLFYGLMAEQEGLSRAKIDLTRSRPGPSPVCERLIVNSSVAGSWPQIQDVRKVEKE